MIIPANSIPQLLEDVKRKHFFGVLSLQFRDGEVTLIERKETIITDKANQGGPRAASDRSR